MMRLARRLAAVLIVAGGLAAGPSAAAVVTPKEIEEALTCQCGCGLTVHSCNHLQCGSGIPLKNEVAALVAQGLERDEILVRFRDKYGEKILSSPTAEGFNLTAWIMPFAALAMGVGIVLFTVRRWSARSALTQGESAEPPLQLSAVERARLEAELRRED